MKRIIEFPVANEDTLLVEVEDYASAEGRLRGSSVTEVAERARQTLEDSLERIRPAATAIIANLRKISDAPEQISLEFGIKFSAQAGVVLAATGVEANFKVTLSWNRRSSEVKAQ